MIPTNHQIFTVGHSTHSAEQFLGLLQDHSVKAVADVRSSPYSRFNPQFNRESLKRFLNGNGVHYVFLGRELGARSEDESCYESGRVQYGRLAQTELFGRGIDRVIQGHAQFNIALMCSEKEPLECHRSLLVAKALTERGLPVSHIHADGRLESHEAAMERLLDVTGISKQDMFLSHEQLLAKALAKQEKAVAYVEEEHAANHATNEST